MIPLSHRVESLKSSPTIEISARAAYLKSQGLDVISLAAGEPDFNTPEVIRKAAYDAMEKGITRYTPSAGFLALRQALATKIQKENGFDVDPEEIIVTAGAKQALYLALQCLAEEGQSILLPTPAWVSYGPMIELAGAKFFPLPLKESDGFRPNLERWKNLGIPQNTKGIIINSPGNPTGVVLSKEDLIKLVGWALQRDLWIISDEVYDKITYDGHVHTSIASLGPEVKNHTITVGSYSKTYCMTGWRLGWAIAPQPLIKKMSALQSQSVSNVTSFVQWAGIEASNLPSSVVEEMVAVFDKRRKYCMSRLDKLSKFVSYVPPSGAFYIFVNIAKFLEPRKMNDVDFCKAVLDEKHVGLVPGSAFGQENYVRLSYATSDENLEKAFDRLEEYFTQN